MDKSFSLAQIGIARRYRDMLAFETKAAKLIESVHPEQRRSATNLIHYLALRRTDLRDVQDALHDIGLSSLASSESHAMRQVQVLMQWLDINFSKETLSEFDAAAGTQLIRHRANNLFGKKKEDSTIPHLMVTFDSGLANDYKAVKALLKAGMNIARINCAHDAPDKWLKMIENVRRATHTTGHRCKIYLDLAGPKIRTTLLGKGRHKDQLKVKEQDVFFLAEATATFDKKEKVVGCTLPGVVKDLQKGARVLFDDGLFEAVVEAPDANIATLRMTRISAAKPRLKPEKGINFPDTELSVSSLTDFDKSVLPFALQHADLLGFSFVRSPADVAELQSLLRKNKRPDLPIVLKIETYEAVQNLPALLLQGMAQPMFGVMIARGDLAVEIGFERLSEIQEEILWLCEAAHVPVIWATQVLDTLNKRGIATRSEVTDAALAAQAECVMLNKGKYLLTVLATLRDILQRSGGHHAKKRYLFRPLNIAKRFLNGL